MGANIRDHAMILPDDATPKPDGIFGKDSSNLLKNQKDAGRSLLAPLLSLPRKKSPSP